MAYLIHGGPFGLGGEGLDQLLKGSQLPSTQEIVRQAAVSNARHAQQAAPEPHAANGVESQKQTHESNHEQDAKHRFPPEPPAYDARGAAPAPEAPAAGTNVDVKT
jgi:hypothetical protein